MVLLHFIAILAIAIMASAMPSTPVALEAPEPHHETCGQVGWFYHDNNCYLIDPRYTDTMNWHDAVAFCPTASSKFPEAYLAEVMNEDEQAFLYQIVHLWVELDHSSHFWLGGHDLLVEGQWEWAYSRQPN